MWVSEAGFGTHDTRLIKGVRNGSDALDVPIERRVEAAFHVDGLSLVRTCFDVGSL